MLKIKGKIVQSTEIGIKSIKIIYCMYHVLYSWSYDLCKENTKNRIKVFVSSLSSHYLHWTRIIKKTMLFCCRWKREQCFCCRWKRRQCILLSLEKRQCFFAVVGKKDNVFLLRWKRSQYFLLSLKRKQCFCCHWKTMFFAPSLEKKTMFFTVVGL